MTKRTSFLALCALVLGATAIAQDHESVFKLAIDDGTAEGAVDIEINSTEQNLDLDELQLGESRAVTTTDGRPVTVTRTEDAFDFNVDGRTVSMPISHHEEASPAHHSASGKKVHKEVHVMREVDIDHAGSPDTVMIVSGQTLDDATRASIVSALSAAGLNNVEFIESGDSLAAHGAHDSEDVRIIRKEIRVTD